MVHRLYDYCKIIKNHFNKNLVISAKDKERFESSTKCWICNKLFDLQDNLSKRSLSCKRTM